MALINTSNVGSIHFVGSIPYLVPLHGIVDCIRGYLIAVNAWDSVEEKSPLISARLVRDELNDFIDLNVAAMELRFVQVVSVDPSSLINVVPLLN